MTTCAKLAGSNGVCWCSASEVVVQVRRPDPGTCRKIRSEVLMVPHRRHGNDRGCNSCQSSPAPGSAHTSSRTRCTRRRCSSSSGPPRSSPTRFFICIHLQWCISVVGVQCAECVPDAGRGKSPHPNSRVNSKRRRRVFCCVLLFQKSEDYLDPKKCRPQKVGHKLPPPPETSLTGKRRRHRQDRRR